MTRTKLFLLVVAVLVTAAGTVVVAPPESLAQGCALCYQSAAASGPRLIQALRSGILVLTVVPAFICIGITWLAWRRRNFHNENVDPSSPTS